MPASVVGRQAETRLVRDFLAGCADGPAGLAIEGDPGIGKTTLWSMGIEEARDRGFTLLTTRASATKSVLAYTCLADLLGGVDPTLLSGLPEPQRIAVEQVLLRADRVATDQRAVAAGFLSIVGALAETASVLIAIDDLQWVDPSSLLALSFAARRLTGPVGLLVTARRGETDGTWPPLDRPSAVQRIALPPLSTGALHTVIAERLGRSFPRPTMTRIADASGGNPFYALELARSVTDGRIDAGLSLPPTLTELIRTTTRTRRRAADDALLAAACLATPRLGLVARAVGTEPEDVAASVEELENDGIVRIVGDRLMFQHPIYALHVYREASPDRRRAMHRRLAALVEEPEVVARHLALSATDGDTRTLRALDDAAASARRRGAPAAAAELTNFALELGGDSTPRRMLLAQDYFQAGDPNRARDIVERTIAELEPGVQRAQAISLLGYVRVLDDGFTEAADLLADALPEAAEDPALLVTMLVTLAFALFNAGRLDAAAARADEAVTHAGRCGSTKSLSQALSMRSTIRFLRGDGVDDDTIERACALEAYDAEVPTLFRPRVHRALMHACSGRLDEGHAQLTQLRKESIDRGDEGGLMFLLFHDALTLMWRGEFAEAEVIVEDTGERAAQLGGDLPMSVALTSRALLAAYAGRADDVRRDVDAARVITDRSGSRRLAEWPLTALGLLEVSLGDYAAAMAAMGPLRERFQAAPDAIEIIAGAYLPESVEALIHLGECAAAEPLVAALERNGRRLQRPWMSAVGARGRAMLLTARGDIGPALAAAEEAMTHHAALAMPFERARTQLVLGDVLRRQRRRDAAAGVFGEALQTFERLGTPLWAARARAALGRGQAGAQPAAVLTPSERRVAELAAAGLTNRKLAAEIFISPKTVEATLSRIYVKLGIRSRAELGRYISQVDR